MRISDWSSDVCSSDLPQVARACCRNTHGHDRCSGRSYRAHGRSCAPCGPGRTTWDKPSLIPHFCIALAGPSFRSEEHTSELQSLMRTSYAVFCLTKKKFDNIK